MINQKLDVKEIVSQFWNEENTVGCENLEEEAYAVSAAAGIQQPTKEILIAILDEMEAILSNGLPTP